MRKFWILLIALLFSVVGCGGTNLPEDHPPIAEPHFDAPEPTPTPTPVPSVFSPCGFGVYWLWHWNEDHLAGDGPQNGQWFCIPEPEVQQHIDGHTSPRHDFSGPKDDCVACHDPY